MTNVVCAFLAESYEDHVLHHLHRLEQQMTQFASDQAHLDSDVQALTGIFSQLEAQIAQLKAAVAAGGPVDFTAADQLVADGQTFLNPTGSATPGAPDLSNVPSDASTMQTPGAVVPPVEPSTGDVATDEATGTGSPSDTTGVATTGETDSATA